MNSGAVTKLVITIDGPSCSGKSTVAKRVAEALFFKHLNSGLLYRTLTYLGLTHFDLPNWPPDTIAENFLSSLAAFAVDFAKDSPDMQVAFGGKVINEVANSSLVSQYVPILSQVPAVRAFVKTKQHEAAAAFNLVADGRDCGTEVFPQAVVKIFLTASLEKRAEWAFGRAQQQDFEISLQEIKEGLAKRDHLDKTRAISPLRQAPDAIVIDATELSLMDVLKKIICAVGSRI